MNPKEYTQLRQMSPEEPQVIQGSMLKNQQNRTLIWGYTLERMDFHVYLKNGDIYIYVEGQPLVEESTVTSNLWYVPSKRAYPECCDYEFCCLLKQAGVNIPFTTWFADRAVPISGFYGPLE
jgi:hypothetical protein